MQSSQIILPLFFKQNFKFTFKNLGTYGFQQGPQLGTAAEYKMLYNMGATLVGMSTAQECLYLNQQNISNLAFSVPVCQYHPFINLLEPSHEQVLEASSLAIPELLNIIKPLL